MRSVSVALGMWAAWPALALGQGLAEPRPITPEGSSADRVALAVDEVDNAFVSVVLDGKARVVSLGSAFSGEALLWDINIPQDEPSIAVGPLEVAWVAFSAWDNELGSSGREVFLASNPGGVFGPVTNITRNRIDDRLPRLALDPTGAPRLVWCEGDGAASTIFFYEHQRGPSRALFGGDRPSLAVDRKGRARIAFARDGGIWVAGQDAAGFGEPVEIDHPGDAEQVAPIIGVDGLGREAVVYASAGELRLALRTGDSFEGPRVIDRGLPAGTAVFDAHFSEPGRLAVAYLKGGDVFLVRGDPAGALLAVPLTRSPEVETSPGIREDAGGNIHLVFIRDGRAYYVNSAPPPRAGFSADPVEGELPLAVEFRDLSIGEVRSWRWSFGDGDVSSVQNPVHTYATVGVYPVRLQVLGPGGESLLIQESMIKVSEASNTMRIADATALPGQKGVWTPVIGYHREAIQGFQIAGRFDPRVVDLREINFQSTAVAAYSPEFFSPSISEEEGYFTLGLILDYDTPFDGRKLPPGRDQRLINLVFDVAPGAPPGDSMIELANGIGPAALYTLYTVDGTSRPAILTPGKLRVLPGAPPIPRKFLRGDLDQSGRVNMADIVALIGYLFSASPATGCLDALDSDDSGEIDLSDVVHLLGFLFLGGPPPEPPFPALGLDPTDDLLPACTE